MNCKKFLTIFFNKNVEEKNYKFERQFREIQL